ncbi:toll/interleukin-1 receptor domain-containing protein [bacterium]|nr:toll/interleukin-1 receptor domain-containing protein [bacterium]
MRELRNKFLISLYKNCSGTFTNEVNVYEISDELGLTRKEVDKITRYLKEEGYLEYHSFGGGILITIFGLIQAEEILEASDSQDVKEIKRKRAEYLNLVYEMSDGDTMEIFNMWELGNRLDFSRGLVEKIFLFYKKIGFLISRGMGGSISITHQAVEAIEDAFSESEVEETDNQKENEDESTNTNEGPTCFISYSWDSEEHKNWVRKLAEDLQKNGVHTHLDQWDTKLGGDLPKYMEKCITESDYVLLVCTPTYAEKANNRKGGVGYEHTIITGELFTSTNEGDKYIPILKQGDEKESKPNYFKTKFHSDFRNSEKYENSIKDLLRVLHNVPKYKRPELGPKPDFFNDVSNGKNASTQSVEIFYSISYGSKLYEARQLRNVYGIINFGIKNNSSNIVKYPKLALGIKNSYESRNIKLSGIEANIQEGFENFYGGTNIVIHSEETLVFVSYSYKIDAKSRKFEDVSLEYSISGEDISPVKSKLKITKEEVLNIIFDSKTGVKLKI